MKKIYNDSEKTKKINSLLENKATKIYAKGLIGSAISFQIAALFKQSEHPFLLIFKDKEEAAYYLNEGIELFKQAEEAKTNN